MKGLKRKNYSLEEAKIKKLRRLLNARTEVEAVQTAVDMVLFQKEALKAWLENAGVGGDIEQTGLRIDS